MRTLEQATVLSPENKRLLGEVKHVIRDVAPEAAVLLYGSVARGTQEAESDYDILVLTPQILPSAQRAAIETALYEIELSHGVVIALIFRCQEDWERHRGMPFCQAVERDAIRL